jgi:hypothetical protein
MPETYEDFNDVLKKAPSYDDAVDLLRRTLQGAQQYTPEVVQQQAGESLDQVE